MQWFGHVKNILYPTKDAGVTAARQEGGRKSPDMIYECSDGGRSDGCYSRGGRSWVSDPWREDKVLVVLYLQSSCCKA